MTTPQAGSGTEQRAVDAEPFSDTPLLAAKRRAFDSPTQVNLDALIAEATRAANEGNAEVKLDNPVDDRASYNAPLGADEFWHCSYAREHGGGLIDLTRDPIVAANYRRAGCVVLRLRLTISDGPSPPVELVPTPLAAAPAPPPPEEREACPTCRGEGVVEDSSDYERDRYWPCPDCVVNRRNRVDLFTPAERAIYDAVAVVEAAGAHPRLTDAVDLLAKARSAVADFVDGKPLATPPRATPASEGSEVTLAEWLAHFGDVLAGFTDIQRSIVETMGRDLLGRVGEDSARLDEIEDIVRGSAEDGWVEVYLSGLRRGQAPADAFQFETNPNHLGTTSGPTLRAAIDAFRASLPALRAGATK